MEDSRRRYSTFAKSLIFGTQMIVSVLMAVCAVILTEYINQKIFDRRHGWALFPWARQSFWMLTVFGIIWLFCLCYMTVAAGKRADDRLIHLNMFDRLRTELQFLLLAGAMGLLLFLAMQIHRQDYQMMGRMIMAGTFALLAQLCFMGIYLSLVRKIKSETFVSNSFIGIFLSNFRQNIRNPYLQTGSLQKKKLLEGLERITQGELDYKLDLREFRGIDMQLAEGINHIVEGLNMVVSERVQDERMKANMITNISHDLKTPIATIKSYGESIKDGIYPYDTLEKSVDVIIENADRLEQKVHSLLFMNRVEYLISQDCEGIGSNMEEIVETVVQNTRFIRSDIQILTNLEEVYFDGLAEPWRVVVENIIENALRYAKTTIDIHLSEEEGLTISNDGPCMDEDRLKVLFKPYEMGKGGKFGLGLSIVAKVVSANGYEVVGENMAEGVIFRIYKPKNPVKKGR